MQNIIDNLWLLLKLNINVNSVCEIIIIAFIGYALYSLLRNTRMMTIIKGGIIVAAFYIVCIVCKFSVLSATIKTLFQVAAIAIVLMFAPELKKTLESLGGKVTRKNLERMFLPSTNEQNYLQEGVIKEIVKACDAMSAVKTGALIIIEHAIPLTDVADTGIDVNGRVTSQLLINIFEKNTPLHDGAVLIMNNKVAAATCYLPLSENKEISKALGTRHRAALGISENSDAIAVVVSEETGGISICKDGILERCTSKEELESRLFAYNARANVINAMPSQHTLLNHAKKAIVALVLSFIVWITALYVMDPVSSKTYENVPLTMVNEDRISEDVVYTTNAPNEISVTVTANESVLTGLSSSDFTATYDIGTLTYANTADVTVKLNKNVDVTSVTSSFGVVAVTFEDKAETTIPVQVTYQNKKDEYYYYADDMTLLVSGAQSAIKTLDYAHATVDVSELEPGEYDIPLSVVIYDKNGNTVTNSSLTYNADAINSVVHVYNCKEVPVVIDKDDATSIDFVGYVAPNVTIAGSDTELGKIEELHVKLPTESSETTVYVKLKDYLPEGVYLADTQDDTIEIKLLMEEETE